MDRKFKDRMTRQEALDLIELAKANPEIMSAYTDPASPLHQTVKDWAKATFYWAYDHPQTSDGLPVAVEELSGNAASDRYAPEWWDRLTVEEAQAKIEQMWEHPELAAALKEGSHEDHEDATFVLTQLHRVAVGEDTTIPIPVGSTQGDYSSDEAEA